MQAKLLSIVSLMAFISCSWCEVSLYSFGMNVGDTALMSGANPAAYFQLKESYPVYGYGFTKIYISDNGYVTLNAPVLSTFPKPFPISSGSYRSRISTMIAPYWSDVDTRCGGFHEPGHVYYRQLHVLKGSDLYNIIQKEVSLVGGPGDAAFEPTSVLIVTWKAVKSADCDDKINTFQLVLTTDGSRTFAMFRYRSLQWHTPYLIGRGGKPHGPATAGVNARYYAGYTPGKFAGFNVDNDPLSIIDHRLVSMSNVGVPGLFVYPLN